MQPSRKWSNFYRQEKQEQKLKKLQRTSKNNTEINYSNELNKSEKGTSIFVESTSLFPCFFSVLSFSPRRPWIFFREIFSLHNYRYFRWNKPGTDKVEIVQELAKQVADVRYHFLRNFFDQLLEQKLWKKKRRSYKAELKL